MPIMKMDILVVIPIYEPAWSAGGTVTATSNLCRGLADIGQNVTVLATNADSEGGKLDVPLDQPVNRGGVEVRYFDCTFGVKHGFYSRSLSNYINDNVGKYDIVHISAMWQLIQRQVYHACKNKNVPYVVCPHGSFSPWNMKQHPLFKRFFTKFVTEKTLVEAAGIHYTTRKEFEKSRKVVPSLDRVPRFTVPNAIDVAKYSDMDKAQTEYKNDKKELLIISVGRIHKKKSYELVIDAISDLDLAISYDIIGPEQDAKYAQSLKQQAEKQNVNLTITGMIPESELLKYYNSADLFVLPSSDENFGMVVAEAMAAGLPVLISNNVDLCDIVEETSSGYVVNQNVDEIRESILDFTQHSTKNLSNNAMIAANENFSRQKVAAQMVSQLDNLIRLEEKQ